MIFRRIILQSEISHSHFEIRIAKKGVLASPSLIKYFAHSKQLLTLHHHETTDVIL
jgi:hypothetical protein